MDAGAQQVLAFRLAGQGLAAPAAGSAVEVLRSWAVQDSPPGTAALAVAARAPRAAPGELDSALAERSAVALYNPRTATAVLPAVEAAAFATALLPTGEDQLEDVLGTAAPEGGSREEAADLAVGAVADALDGRELSRDDLHEELRGRLPAALLPWCPGCGSHHARRGLLVMASLRGRLCLAGRAGRQPRFARTDQWAAWDPPDAADAGADLVRRYLRGYGPSTSGDLAAWAGIGRVQARELWSRVEPDLEPVTVDGHRAGWLPAGDLPLLRDPPPAPGVRLLAAGDPGLLGRDRALLVPDRDLRARLWRPTGSPGLVLADGRAVALWRARKQGRRLDVTVERFAGPVSRRAVAAEADRLAPHRGCATATVSWA